MGLLDILHDMSRGEIKWGENDCCMAAAAVLEAQFGVDLMAGWRGHYGSYRDMVRLLRRRNAESLAGAIVETAKAAGFMPISDTFETFDLAPVALKDQQTGELMTMPALYSDGLWCMRSTYGFNAVECEPETAWRCPS